MIAIAVESSNSRGMGHLFRSLVLVNHLKARGLSFCYFINDDEKSQRVLKTEKIDYQVVDYTDESNWEAELVQKYGIDIWINDKFETSEKMAKNIIASGSYLALIDDIGVGENLANVNFISLTAYTKDRSNNYRCLQGLQYTILNDEIERFKRKRDSLNKIIVTLGGSDPQNNTVRVVRELLKYQYCFDVVIGPNYRFERQLQELRLSNRFRIIKNAESLIRLFASYDLAITGGGVTCCEAMASGLPCLIIANAPHERNTGKGLQESGACIYMGDYLEWDKDYLMHLPDLEVEKMSEKGMQIFSSRACDEIIDYVLCDIKKERNL